MSTVGQKERATQNRVIKLFRERLNYTYLGNWEDEELFRPIENDLLLAYLKKPAVQPQRVLSAARRDMTDNFRSSRRVGCIGWPHGCHAELKPCQTACSYCVMPKPPNTTAPQPRPPRQGRGGLLGSRGRAALHKSRAG